MSSFELLKYPEKDGIYHTLLQQGIEIFLSSLVKTFRARYDL